MPDTTTAPREVVNLDALAATIADSLQGPTYAAREDVAPDGFVTFDTVVQPHDPTFAPGLHVIRATVDSVSDGEESIEDAAGQVVEIVVRRVTR